MPGLTIQNQPSPSSSMQARSRLDRDGALDHDSHISHTARSADGAAVAVRHAVSPTTSAPLGDLVEDVNTQTESHRVRQQGSSVSGHDPIAESDNSDAIALRAAMSILEMQREQSRSDLQTLERLKNEALADPATFERELRAGRVKSRSGREGILGTHLGDVTKRGLQRDGQKRADDEDEDMQNGDEVDDDQMDTSGDVSKAPFAGIPAPQNIVRCPPINWEKYHVVGGALDKLHQEQTSRPSAGEPQQDGRVPPMDERAPEAVIAAPYRPFTDEVAKPMVTRSGSKKGTT